MISRYSRFLALLVLLNVSLSAGASALHYAGDAPLRGEASVQVASENSIPAPTPSSVLIRSNSIRADVARYNAERGLSSTVLDQSSRPKTSAPNESFYRR